ncbi:transglycosylase domain-containing protein [Pseudoteredinibacter isoporae]|uniref:transglycosylase domain-containing protein n=1 Tax=Pseudoteredinibacter isoporae TaxID=570281 RepID=UPI003104778B
MPLDITERLFQIYTLLSFGQLFFLPLLISVLLIDPARLPLNWNLSIHKALLIGMLLAPLVLLEWNTLHTTQSLATHTDAEQAATELKLSTTQESEQGPGFRAHQDFHLQLGDIFYFLSGALLFASSLGLILFATRLLINHGYLYHLSRNAGSSVIQNRFHIIRSNSVHSAFSIGFIRKKIFLPNKLLTGSEEETLIIEHEKNHFNCRHHYWTLAEQCLRHIFWFNPLIHGFYRRGELLRELQCDQLTARQSSPLHYSKLLLSSAERAQREAKRSLGTQHWLHKKTLKRRLQMLLKVQSFNRRLIFIPGSVLLLTLVLLATAQWKNQDHYLTELALNHIKQEYQISLEKHPAVKYADVPQVVTQALLKHEDQDFFNHGGISLKASSRAMVNNVSAWINGEGRWVSGGSTITQQLAKSFLKEKRSLSRKMREAKLARIIEANYRKEDILEMYLNRVYFGNNAWGLATASHTYFSKPYQELNLSEAAMLIPFLEAPTKYNMIHNPQLASSRQLNLLRKLTQ